MRIAIAVLLLAGCAACDKPKTITLKFYEPEGRLVVPCELVDGVGRCDGSPDAVTGACRCSETSKFVKVQVGMKGGRY
jgi:hypothetical protein